MSIRTDAPTILVVFGATGDLMSRKIVPSIRHLHSQGLLPHRFAVVGFSRRPWTDDDFRSHVSAILAEKYPGEDIDPALIGMFTYQQGTFDEAAAYTRLAGAANAITNGWGTCSNKLFYLAVPPENYATILTGLADNGLTAVCDPINGFTRVLVEKPFGHDVESSKRLDAMLASLLREEQIYRIDHYLAKEMLQGILAFRFHNDLLEPEWNRDNVERIDISLLETLGVEHRGAFYDEVGALRDVGQNHLLQMLALVTMEQPATFDANAIRSARARLLRTLRPLDAGSIATQTYRSQYQGYRAIPGVAPDSTTETYFRLAAELSGPRWAGVPFTFESGKRIGAQPRKHIEVTFRHRRPCLCDGAKHLRNRVIFTLEPDDTIRITFWAKKPGFDYEVEQRTFEFALYERTAKLQYVEEYSKLLYDAICGDQTAFVSTEEVQAMWDFIDPVTEAWERDEVELHTYAPDTDEAPAHARVVLAASEVEGGATLGAAQGGEKASAGTSRQVGVLGLGKMGAGLALNLIDHGWDVVGYNRTAEVARALAPNGLRVAETYSELVAALSAPRTVWLMVPAGKAVDAVLFGDDAHPGLADLLEPGDLVIDGGNSHYVDDAPRAARLAQRGIAFLDCGTSGGPAGARNGACLMIGGDRSAFERTERLFADVSVPGGYRFFEGAGSGHFVKMVHNGIEYGMMQAIAEGFAVMRASGRGLDLAEVADIYQHSSVIESRLVGWLRDAYRRFGDDLAAVSGTAGHTGEGAWTLEAARELGVEAPAIEAALRLRIESEHAPGYVAQIIQALRNEFGGHGLSAAKSD